jgi:hypothetical protein
MTKKQWIYFAAAVGILATEILIALFVHDGIIRPYIGDILAVIFVYCVVRVFVKNPPKLLALYVFLFAVAVEFAQLFGVVRLFGIGDDSIVGTIAGGTFDLVDIGLYAVGAGIMFAVQMLEKRKQDNGY